MKKLVTILCLFISIAAFAQKGSYGIINMGSFYRISVTALPKVPNLMYYDTRELIVDVRCIQTMELTRTVIPISNTMPPYNFDYYLNGNILITVRVVYKKNNIQIGYQSLPSKCIFGLNPTSCVQKV